MRTLLLLFTLFICSSAFCQKQSEIDSLEDLLTSSLETKTLLRNKLYLSELLENTDRERSRNLAQEVLNNNSSYKVSDSLRSAAYLRLAVAAYKEKKDSIALVHLNKIDSLFNKNDSIISPLIHSKFYRSQISKFTFSMDGILAAKKHIIDGKRLADIINDPLLQNLMTYQLGEWHGFFSQAEFPEKHLDTARMYFEKVLPYYKNSENLEYESRVYFSLASVAVYNKNFDKAEKYYLQRLETISKTNDSLKIGDALTALGGYYRRTKQPKKALQKLNEAIKIANSKGYSDIGKKGELMHSYALVYEQQGNYKAAMNSLFSELKLRDSLFEDQNTKRGVEMAAKYESKKKEQEIALLTSQNKFAEQQKKNQRNLMLGGLGLTTTAGVFLFLGYRNRKKTNDKLRELDQVKSNFFANISHEFRTPLSLIAGPIEQQLQKEDITAQERQNLQIAQRNSTRLVTLVDQLLDLSKLESGHFSLKVQQGNLDSFLKSLTGSFDFIAQENEHTYTKQISVEGTNHWFDTDALEKIITNLISNAIKYSPSGESISVSATAQNQELQLTIKNSGAQLPQEILSTLFNRFQRADETTAGTGIGLALTKELVTLHKGSITVKSNTDWTTFMVVLPLSESVFTTSEKAEGVSSDYAFAKSNLRDSRPSGEHSSKAKQQPTLEHPLVDEVDIFSKDEKPILLIVDDNEDMRTYVSSLFNKSHTIHTAVNGKEGFEKALSEVPDFIITDLMMPEDDGIMLTQNCKTTEATSHIPVLMLTAKAGDENKLIGLETGADAYLTKPFNTEILKTTVHNLQETRDKLQERFSQEVVLLPKDIATNSTDERFLNNLQEVMDKSLIESDFNTEAFAEAVGMSRMQLHRKLKALTGLSATEFIRGQRLKLAAQMLKKSDINVSQVGYAVGFNNHSYFTKCFKEKYGISPSEYSKKS